MQSGTDLISRSKESSQQDHIWSKEHWEAYPAKRLWEFCQIYNLVALRTEMKWLYFEVKRSKVKVTAKFSGKRKSDQPFTVRDRLVNLDFSSWKLFPYFLDKKIP